MALDPDLLREATETRGRLADLQHDVERTRSDYHHTIRRLHAAGATLREIAEALGLSHQRVHQIVEAPAGGEQMAQPLPPPFAQPLFPPMFRRRGKGGEGMFRRFTQRARQVLVFAQEEARTLKHTSIGTEHILLGLLRESEGGAGRALASLGVSVEEVRLEVRRRFGEDADATSDPMPFSPDAKKVLELALREALALGHNHIGTEAILLGLIRCEEDAAVDVLRRFGAEPLAIRAKLAA